VDKETYNKFIDGLRVGEVNVAAADVQANTPSLDYDQCTAQMDFDVVGYEPISDDATQFAVFTTASLTLNYEEETEFFDKGEEAGYVMVDHLIYYRSSVPISDEIFEIFSDGNVQFHVWPFVREYIQDVTRRFGWPAFQLPPFVSSNEESSDEESEDAE
jgi:preprotein translocase subunit SecB